MEYLFDLFNVLTAAVALASTVAALTPTPTDDVWVAKAYKLLDVIALNIGKAKQQVKILMTAKTEMDIALEALERIAEHEKECGERWAECTVELRELRKATENHAARWERLAWLVVSVVITGVVSTVIINLG